MSFVSISFAVLYGLALLLRVSVEKTKTAFLLGILALSWVFYAWHVPSYLILIVGSTVVDYSAARALAALPASRQRRRRAILIASLAVNIGLLGWFKYAGFLADTVQRISALLGFDGLNPMVAHGLLPIGISFYTFQSMSYTIDVYRGHLKAERSFLRVATYVAFFPQLVAGPIVRATDFLYQLRRPRPIRAVVWGQAGYLIVRGLFLKMVVADNLGRVVDTHWTRAADGAGGGVLALVMMVLFAGQLFSDFAGYSSIARGLAYTLGFRLPVNFDAPYIAKTFSEFWRRWHISLSSWMRDYLYIPLGGSRHGRRRAYLNLFLVMLISGLWHGAAWTFVAWGAIHGVAVAAERAFGIHHTRSPRWVLTLWAIGVQATWVFSMGFFRAASLDEGLRMVRHALGGTWHLARTGLPSLGSEGLVTFGLWLLVPLVVLHGRVLLSQRFRVAPPGAWEKTGVAGMMLAAIATLYTSGQQFIYFQF